MFEGGGSLAGIRVLAVDDEPDARDLVRRVLQRCGAAVTIAGSAQEAIGLLQSDRPHVIVSDIGMPNRDGYEFMRVLRSLPPERGGRLPAVALTAYARPEDRRKALLAGYQSHLSKPINPEELVLLVSSLARPLAL